MKLYEVNAQIEELLAQLEPDPETGEVLADVDSVLNQLNALAMKREDILQYLAKLAVNTKADVQSLKAEEKRLHDRRQAAERRQERLIDILDRECAGQKTDLGVATLYYRKSFHVEIANAENVVKWCDEKGHQDCYYQPAPELSKLRLSQLLRQGIGIPGVELVDTTSCYLK